MALKANKLKQETCGKRAERHDCILKKSVCSFVTVCLYILLTDQTPTPTRFLQNCEEVGLFKEIEEEFLQAQEEEKSKQVLFYRSMQTKTKQNLKSIG